MSTRTVPYIRLMLAKRFAESRKRAGLAQVDLAVAMGDRYDHRMISHVERGRRSLRLDGLANAAKEMGVSVDYLLGLTDDPTAAVRLVSEKRALEAAVRDIPIFEVTPAAGSGAMVFGEEIIGHQSFRADWLARQSIDPSQSAVVSVRGESMESTLPDGCSILVDRSSKERREDRIYVVRTEDGLVVKRADRDADGRWLLLSDNPAWEPALWPRGAEVIGEVRWVARTL